MLVATIVTTDIYLVDTEPESEVEIVAAHKKWGKRREICLTKGAKMKEMLEPSWWVLLTFYLLGR